MASPLPGGPLLTFQNAFERLRHDNSIGRVESSLGERYHVLVPLVKVLSKGPMSFHDSVVEKARRDGNTSAQFHQAAQKHANATWIYLIIAGVVWYFSS